MEKAIVFDMDGVLFDTERVCNIIWMELFRELHLENAETAMKACVGMNRKGEAAYFAEHYPEVDFDRFADRLSGGILRWLDENGTPVMKGAREILTWLRENMWKTALASSSRLSSIEHHLKDTGLYEMFDVIVAGDMVTNGKPHPEIYLTACQRLNADPATTYAVEDSRNGLISAYDAGMMTILVPDTIEPTPEMLEIAYRTEKDLLCVRDYLASLE